MNFEISSNSYAQLTLFNQKGADRGLKELTFRTELGFDYYNQLRKQYTSRFARIGTDPQFARTQLPAASASDSRVAFTNININNVFNYINSTSRKHQYDLYFGQTYQQSYTSNNGVTSEGFDNDFTRQVSAGQIQIGRSGNETEFRFNSVFFNGNYKYDNRFVFNGTIRTDGSSRFGKDNQYGVFPALGTAWIISNDSIFLRYKERNPSSPLELARFNVSYGRSGNAQVNNFRAIISGLLTLYIMVSRAYPPNNWATMA